MWCPRQPALIVRCGRWPSCSGQRCLRVVLVGRADGQAVDQSHVPCSGLRANHVCWHGSRAAASGLSWLCASASRCSRPGSPPRHSRVREGAALLVGEPVEDHVEHPGAHVLQRTEAICELLPVQLVGCSDHQCAAGDLGKDRGVGHREQGRGVDEHDVVLGAQLLEEVCHLLRPVTRQRWPARLLRLWRQPSLLRSWR